MARVNLEILRGPYRPALAKHLDVESCRLLTDVSLCGTTTWLAYRPAIVDTGAPLSLFPRRIWHGADYQPVGRVYVGGLTRKPECMFDVTLAIVQLVLRDPHQQIGPIETHALLADHDDVPTLLGMR